MMILVGILTFIIVFLVFVVLQARRYDQARDRFIATITHDLRTPLSAILQGVSLLLEGIDGPITPEQKDTLAIIRRNADRLAEMITSILGQRKSAKKTGGKNAG